MPKDIQSPFRLTPPERRLLLRSAHLIHRQDELDIRSRPRDSDSSRLPGRILIITPRKIGNAPQRNLLRRRLKAIFREEKIFNYSYDFVVYSRKGSADLSFEDLKAILFEASRKLPSRSVPSK